MIQMINKLKKNQKGFTLVELIVVLVILAILAAFTIPAMLGFVNDARGKASIAEAREVYVAAQSAASDVAGKKSTGLLTHSVSTTAGSDAADIKTQMEKLINGDIPGNGNATVTVNEIDGTGATKPSKSANTATVAIDKDGKVHQVKYVDASTKYLITITSTASGTDANVEDYDTAS